MEAPLRASPFLGGFAPSARDAAAYAQLCDAGALSAFVAVGGGYGCGWEDGCSGALHLPGSTKPPAVAFPSVGRWLRLVHASTHSERLAWR